MTLHKHSNLKLEHHFRAMKYIRIFIFTFFILNFYNFASSAEVYFVDIKKILNESKAGKEAQSFLKKKFENENKKFEKEGTALKKEESDLIAKKKIVTPEEYKKKLTDPNHQKWLTNF